MIWDLDIVKVGLAKAIMEPDLFIALKSNLSGQIFSIGAIVYCTQGPE